MALQQIRAIPKNDSEESSTPQASEAELFAARRQERLRQQQAAAESIRQRDRAHTIIGAIGLSLVSLGAAVAFHWSCACLVPGAVLLAGVVYSRTRPPASGHGDK